MIKERSQPKTSIAPRELHRLLAGGADLDLLDVRTPGEFAGAHIPGATLIPLGDLNVPGFLSQRKHPDKTIYVLCQSGARALRAIEQFQRAGFQDCVLVEGGLQAWRDAGLAVVCGQSRGLPLMRQVQIIVGILSATGAALALTVNPWFALVPLVTGCGLLFAGLTGLCGLALVLSKLPWNRCPAAASSGCATKNTL